MYYFDFSYKVLKITENKNTTVSLELETECSVLEIVYILFFHNEHLLIL